MISMGEQFCIETDKELILQALNLNNVPSVELVDPNTSAYPIIGRKYGHHHGSDLAVINDQDKGLTERFDYFTKLYSIEKEYCFEIQGLTVNQVKKSVSQQMVFNEIPVRTKVYGWDWEETDISTVSEEWKDTAIRALYVTGLESGTVKMGVLANDTIIVLDIHSSEVPYTETDVKAPLPFTMGADVEFMLSCDNELIPASTFFSVGGEVGCDERQIEQDSGEYALAEIRPNHAESPEELFSNLKRLIEVAAQKVPFKNVELRAGSMPFSGYQCGGHIHFGMPISLSLLRALDHYLAIPFAMIEDPQKAKLRRKTKHGGLGRYRIKPYGFEYLSLSSWIIDPKITKSLLYLARLVAECHHELVSDYLYNPLVQRAYYFGNQLLLKQLWEDVKNRLINTSGYSKYKHQLTVLFDLIEKGNSINETVDIRKNWGNTIPNQVYVRGDIIQIPKKTRLKYKLKEGEKVFVSAGKLISTATIQAYPFTFRHPNMVQLSKSLREKLVLPDDWCPKISTSNGAIILGPIIGILAARPFERQTTYFQHLMRIAEERKMLVYVFEPQDIDWNNHRIKGTSLKGEGIFPFPAVIYDRYFLGGENSVDIEEIRVKLQLVYHIPFVNPQSLFTITGNKWDTHQLLQKDHEEYLPDACLLEQSSNLIEMLDKYGEIFLKPVGGAMSMGVIRVIRRPTGIFWFNFSEKAFHQLTSMEELFTLITPLLKKTPYLIQEGIRRKQINGKNLEIRVYMQKNGQQKWLRTGMVSRITNEDVLTEETEKNLRLSRILLKLYPDPQERRLIIKQLADISRSIVTTIEEEVGMFGELAVDLCIDQYDSVKLLEINAKPDNLFSQIRAYKLRTTAGLRLLNYAASLAGYHEDERGEFN